MSAPFEGWACVELLGHRIRYGHVREVTLFGEAFAQVDIPSDPPVREFYGGKSIYGLTPRTEDECRKQNEPWKPRPALSAPEDAELVEDDDQDDSWSPDDEDDLPSERDSDAPRSPT